MQGLEAHSYNLELKIIRNKREIDKPAKNLSEKFSQKFIKIIEISKWKRFPIPWEIFMEFNLKFPRMSVRSGSRTKQRWTIILIKTCLAARNLFTNLARWTRYLNTCGCRPELCLIKVAKARDAAWIIAVCLRSKYFRNFYVKIKIFQIVGRCARTPIGNFHLKISWKFAALSSSMQISLDENFNCVI